MSGNYPGTGSDPFGGRYAQRGLVFGRDAEENSFDRPRPVSGVAMAIGMFLVWCSLFTGLLTVLIVLVSWTLTGVGREMPSGAPSIQVSLLVTAGTWLISMITAVVARHNLRRLRATGGLAKLAVSAVVLGGGLWWVWTVNGIPL
ncbi:hypothetical protein [Ruania albidiflava]|uniref:hypothetical protein n=1 Tax=Ruania albidiflava TaxID=366586 RepID=UPI0023F0C941|nr:hypothetical protein [Ruania albidiflava]